LKLLIIAALLAIIVSLGQALFAMSSGHGNSARMVRALTLRIGISVALFAALMLAWYFGLIDPHGVS
jgi:ABC-type nitrate/sulfonate/bicarbonate transport system substrate-binding protein